MGGKCICKKDRRHIYRMAIQLNYTAVEIFSLLFNNDRTEISILYLKNLIAKLQNNTFATAYLQGPRAHLGRNRMLTRLEAFCLKDFALKSTSMHYEKLADYFKKGYYAVDDANPHASRSTVIRTLKRMNITAKVSSKINIRMNNMDGAEFLKNIRHIDPLNIIDVDETINDVDSFLSDFGFAPKGLKLNVVI
jgi:hypothetical protein